MPRASFFVHLGLEESLRMPGFNADHRQSGFRQAAEQPLRQGSRFQADALELLCGIVERRNQILGMGRNFHLSADFACLVDDAYRCLFDRDVQSAIIFHAALLPLMLVAAQRRPRLSSA